MNKYFKDVFKYNSIEVYYETISICHISIVFRGEKSVKIINGKKINKK